MMNPLDSEPVVQSGRVEKRAADETGEGNIRAG